MQKRYGLFGGTFDPVHHGHLILARTVAEKLDLHNVIFLPSAKPPHKQTQTLTEGHHRAAMIKLAIEGEALFQYDDFDLKRAGPTYTIDTVRHFREVFGNDIKLSWIIGADSLAELSTWHRAAELVDLCGIVTVSRTGCKKMDWSELAENFSADQVARLRANVITTPVIEISATDIRARVNARGRARTREGRSIRYLVPEVVEEYIRRHGLYQTHS